MIRFVYLILANFALAGFAPAAVVLELKDTQTMTSGNMTLNDILQSSQGLSADDLAVVLAASPALGKQVTWTKEQLAGILPDSIKQQVPDWIGAKTCTVSRPAVTYGEAEVRQLISGELSRQLPPDAKFEVLEFAAFNPS